MAGNASGFTANCLNNPPYELQRFPNLTEAYNFMQCYAFSCGKTVKTAHKGSVYGYVCKGKVQGVDCSMTPCQWEVRMRKKAATTRITDRLKDIPAGIIYITSVTYPRR